MLAAEPVRKKEIYMVVTETETGLRELGKAVQDLMLAYYSGNTPSIHEHMNTITAILQQFEHSEYHIEVFLRIEYPALSEDQLPDTISRALFVIHSADEDTLDMHRATIDITILINEAEEIIGAGNIEVLNVPMLVDTPDNPHFMPTEWFSGMLNTMSGKKGERGH